MRIIVIGASGHIGTFLVPRLVRAGHEVVAISRGRSTAYTDAPEWEHVERVIADRVAKDEAGTFGSRVAALDADAVIDLVCFTPESARALVEALRGRTGHLIHCGSVWRYGRSTTLPIAEDDGTTGPAFGGYGEAKAEIARLLAAETASGGLVTTAIHPGHISGPGWAPINPVGNLDPSVWQALAAGETLRIPGDGTQMMHHVHADDVALTFEKAVERREQVAGQDIVAVAPTALSVRGYAEIAAGWFGQETHLQEVTWEEFRAGTTEEYGHHASEHLVRSHCFSTAKAERLLGIGPQHGVEDTVLEAVRSMIERGELKTATPLVV